MADELKSLKLKGAFQFVLPKISLDQSRCWGLGPVAAGSMEWTTTGNHRCRNHKKA